MYVATTTPVNPTVTLTAEQRLAAHFLRVSEELQADHGRPFGFEEVLELVRISGREFYQNHLELAATAPVNERDVEFATSAVAIADADFSDHDVYLRVRTLFDLTQS